MAMKDGIEVRPNGAIRVRFSYVDVSGALRTHRKSGFKTVEDAERYRDGVKAGIERARATLEVPTLYGFNTVREFAESWKETTLRVRYRKNGYKTVEGRVRNHILDPELFLHDMPLQALRKSHGVQFQLDLQAKGLAPKTVNDIVGLVKKMLKDAVDEDLIPRNPWENLERLDLAEPDWAWLRPDECRALLAVVRQPKEGSKWLRRWLLEVLLGCRAGFRASEVSGLFVEDCNLETGDVSIRRGVVDGEVGEPKSKSSRRTIRVPSDVLAELRRRARYALLRPPVDLKDPKSGRVHRGHLFSLTKEGEPHKDLPGTLKRPLVRACKDAGIPRITHRDLRHTYASHLRLKGVPLEDIRDLMGHHALQMVMRYAHIDGERFAEAAKALDELA